MAKIKIIALLPLFRFGFPQSEGEELELEEKQATEIVEAGYAKNAETEAEKLASEKANAEAEKLASEKANAEAEKKAK